MTSSAPAEKGDWTSARGRWRCNSTWKDASRKTIPPIHSSVISRSSGWTEDHNCVFYNYPPELTGRDWQQEICYTLLTDYYGIYPLATWDSQIWWVSQLNIYECRKGQTDYEGRVLCIGNGGCEFSMKSYRQVGRDEQGNPVYETTDDRSAYPANNIYQDNILRMATNAIEYFKNY